MEEWSQGVGGSELILGCWVSQVIYSSACLGLSAPPPSNLPQPPSSAPPKPPKAAQAPLGGPQIAFTPTVPPEARPSLPLSLALSLFLHGGLYLYVNLHSLLPSASPPRSLLSHIPFRIFPPQQEMEILLFQTTTKKTTCVGFDNLIKRQTRV